MYHTTNDTTTVIGCATATVIAALKHRPHPAECHITDFLHYSFFSGFLQEGKNRFPQKKR